MRARRPPLYINPKLVLLYLSYLNARTIYDVNPHSIFRWQQQFDVSRMNTHHVRIPFIANEAPISPSRIFVFHIFHVEHAVDMCGVF